MKCMACQKDLYLCFCTVIKHCQAKDLSRLKVEFIIIFTKITLMAKMHISETSVIGFALHCLQLGKLY